ncbi:MAG: RidA family protein, partial [Acidobacteriota bacterium]
MVKTFGPYSPIKKAGNFYYVSGQVGVDQETNKAGKTISEQTAQALVNMSDLLASEGLAMENVVKTTVYLIDMRDFRA